MKLVGLRRLWRGRRATRGAGHDKQRTEWEEDEGEDEGRDGDDGDNDGDVKEGEDGRRGWRIGYGY